MIGGNPARRSIADAARRADAQDLTLLYRGDLASCNYECGYCPFAKRVDSRAVTEADRDALRRFVAWCIGTDNSLRLLFTPWGEALVRKHYREAIVELSHCDHVFELGVQSNLSRKPDWLADANPRNLQLWCTYHPSQTSRAQFLRRIERLLELGVGFSVGMVALTQDLAEIQSMRKELDLLAAQNAKDIYLWLNAYDARTVDYYRLEDLRLLSLIDPHFSFNLNPLPSLGARCQAGNTALSVNAKGDVRPCHFVAQHLGNLYDGSFTAMLAERPCPKPVCDCYIGYSLRRDLPFVAPLTRGFAPRALT